MSQCNYCSSHGWDSSFNVKLWLPKYGTMCLNDYILVLLSTLARSLIYSCLYMSAKSMVCAMYITVWMAYSKWLFLWLAPTPQKLWSDVSQHNLLERHKQAHYWHYECAWSPWKLNTKDILQSKSWLWKFYWHQEALIFNPDITNCCIIEMVSPWNHFSYNLLAIIQECWQQIGTLRESCKLGTCPKFSLMASCCTTWGF